MKREIVIRTAEWIVDLKIEIRQDLSILMILSEIQTRLTQEILSLKEEYIGETK